MKRILSFMLLFATLLCSSKTLSYNYLNTSFNTEIALNRLNNTTYFLITLITNSEKFLVVDSSKYVIVLNNNSIIQLQPIKNIITKYILPQKNAIFKNIFNI